MTTLASRAAAVALALALWMFSVPQASGFDLPTNALRRAVSTRQAVVVAGWKDLEWKWGYADGQAHVEAGKLRGKLTDAAARTAWLEGVDKHDWEEFKLCLALQWQRAAREKRDVGYGALMHKMVGCAFEEPFGLGEIKLCDEMKKLLDGLEGEWKGADRMNDVKTHLKIEGDDMFVLEPRLVGAQVLMALNFIEGGL